MSIPISLFRLLFSQFDFHEYLRNLQHGHCYLQVFYIKTLPNTGGDFKNSWFFFSFADSYCCEESDLDIETQNFDCVKDVVDILCDCSETELETLELTIDTKEHQNDECFSNSVMYTNLLQEPSFNCRKYERHFGEKVTAIEETVKNTSIPNGVCSSGFSSLWLSPGNSARNL